MFGSLIVMVLCLWVICLIGGVVIAELIWSPPVREVK